MANQNQNYDLLHVKQAEHLVKLFQMIKAQSGLANTGKNLTFKNTELRMISEILSAQYEGKRLISTKLADKLGITRSAVSQIVTKLESEGVLKRVPDAVDKKIAYIEISENVLERYGEDVNNYTEFLNSVVEEFGEEQFNQMYGLFVTFIELMQKKVKEHKK